MREKKVETVCELKIISQIRLEIGDIFLANSVPSNTSNGEPSPKCKSKHPLIPLFI